MNEPCVFLQVGNSIMIIFSCVIVDVDLYSLKMTNCKIILILAFSRIQTGPEQNLFLSNDPFLHLLERLADTFMVLNEIKKIKIDS